jgi:hypothetical protein
MSWGAPKRREGIRAAGGRVLHCVAADGIMRSGLFELKAWRCIFLWVTGCSRPGFDMWHPQSYRCSVSGAGFASVSPSRTPLKVSSCSGVSGRAGGWDKIPAMYILST